MCIFQNGDLSQNATKHDGKFLRKKLFKIKREIQDIQDSRTDILLFRYIF